MGKYTINTNTNIPTYNNNEMGNKLWDQSIMKI